MGATEEIERMGMEDPTYDPTADITAIHQAIVDVFGGGELPENILGGAQQPTAAPTTHMFEGSRSIFGEPR
jgi:hypothetical protein